MLKSNDPALVELAGAAEIELDASKTLPDDFDYLWFLGSTTVSGSTPAAQNKAYTSTPITMSGLSRRL
jgi:hypothetical protein